MRQHIFAVSLAVTMATALALSGCGADGGGGDDPGGTATPPTVARAAGEDAIGKLELGEGGIPLRLEENDLRTQAKLYVDLSLVPDPHSVTTAACAAPLAPTTVIGELRCEGSDAKVADLVAAQ